jgi:hypothetical protein
VNVGWTTTFALQGNAVCLPKINNSQSSATAPRPDKAVLAMDRRLAGVGFFLSALAVFRYLSHLA